MPCAIRNTKMFNPIPLNLPIHPFKITQRDSIYYIFDDTRKKAPGFNARRMGKATFYQIFG
jgi:hypothetical protein